MTDELRRSLSGIVNDLWGTPSPARSSVPAPRPAPSDFPPFEQLWSSVDETVDWTDVLSHDTPNDGLTAPDRWALYREHARQVLSGDPTAYLAVLKATDPLRDLTPWADKLDVSCADADTLQVIFTAQPALTKAQGRRYLAGMSLRIARDLFALLPVLQVEVTAQCENQTLLTIAFHRQELQKVRFSFIDPVAFAQDCGGIFTE